MNTGILLMNTGTADEPTLPAVRNYLREFLMDPAIIGAPEFIRKRIVNHIARRRPERTIANYEQYWTPQGSPFTIGCYKQAERLQVELSGRLAGEVHVVLGMRYGSPSVLDALHELRVAGCEQVVVLPSYPQEVNVCAGTCIKHAHDALVKLTQQYDWHPQVVDVPRFYDLDSYRCALAHQVAANWQYKPGSKLVVSFHSTMLADIEAGDPYRDQTVATANNLAQDLGISLEDVVVSYQSRFDSRKWLQPFTEPTVRGLAQSGVKDVAVVCPIFTVDNMETSLEINRDLRTAFMEEAGASAQFTYIPALGHGAGVVKALADAAQKALDGGFYSQKVALQGTTADTSLPRMLPH